MLTYLIMVLVFTVPNEAEFKAENVSIKVNIQSNIFLYEVTNLGSSPINGFEVKYYAAYNFIVPEGWQKDTTSNTFRSWTDNPEMYIFPDNTAEFSMRVSSRGAVLAKLPVKIKLISEKTIVVPDVWSPSPEPRYYIILIAGLILFLFLLHSFILIYKSRKKIKPSNAAL